MDKPIVWIPLDPKSDEGIPPYKPKGGLRYTIRDDNRGFPPEPKGKGWGGQRPISFGVVDMP